MTSHGAASLNLGDDVRLFWACVFKINYLLFFEFIHVQYLSLTSCLLTMSDAHLLTALALLLSVFAPASFASSHSEAPGSVRTIQADATDFHMFRSYEEGREDFVTIIANYYPLQDSFGGPNYFGLSDDHFYGKCCAPLCCSLWLAQPPDTYFFFRNIH